MPRSPPGWSGTTATGSRPPIWPTRRCCRSRGARSTSYRSSSHYLTSIRFNAEAGAEIRSAGGDEAKQQGHVERLLVRNAVLPEPVLAPAVAMIGADDDRVVGETREQRLEDLVAPLHAGNLTPPAFGRVIVVAEGSP